jgi:tetratricopeptide (TPR) repeat protein
LNACLRIQPKGPWLHLVRAVAWGNIATEKLHAAGPDTVRASRASEQFDDAETDYTTALELLGLQNSPADDLRYIVLVNRGVMRFQRGRATDSIADLTAAVKLNPDLCQAYAELAIVLAREGQTAAAVDRFAEAIARNPRSAPLYRARADIALLQSDPTAPQIEAALHDLDMALRLESPGNPIRARDLANRAWLLERAGRFTEAIRTNDKALALVPDYSAALHQKIDLLIRLKRYDEAGGLCDAALGRGAGARPTWLYKFRALTRELKGDHAGAAADFSEALRKSPGDAALLARRGWAYLASGAAKLALLDFDRSVSLDRSNADAYSGRGAARAMLGMPREAVADAEQSLRHGAPETRRLFGAARIYALAAQSLASALGSSARSSAELARSFEDRAVSLLNEAVQRRPLPERKAFARDMVNSDPIFAPFRRRIKSTATAATDGNTTEGPAALVQRDEP